MGARWFGGCLGNEQCRFLRVYIIPFLFLFLLARTKSVLKKEAYLIRVFDEVQLIPFYH